MAETSEYEFLRPNKTQQKKPNEYEFLKPTKDKPKNIFEKTLSDDKPQDFEYKDKVGLAESFFSGIGHGVLKIAEGTTTLGAALIDFGFNTNLATSIQEAFESLEQKTHLREKAQATLLGNVTSILVQFGVPGVAAYRLANAAMKGAMVTRAGLFAKRAKNVAMGEAIVSTPSDINLQAALGMGPMQSLTFKGERGRAEAKRIIYNKLAFGVEGGIFSGAFDVVGLGFKNTKNIRKLKSQLKESLGLKSIKPYSFDPKKVTDNGEPILRYVSSPLRRFFDRLVIDKISPGGPLRGEISKKVPKLDPKTFKPIIDEKTGKPVMTTVHDPSIFKRAFHELDKKKGNVLADTTLAGRLIEDLEQGITDFTKSKEFRHAFKGDALKKMSNEIVTKAKKLGITDPEIQARLARLKDLPDEEITRHIIATAMTDPSLLRALPKQLQAPAKNIRQTIDSYSKQIAGLSSVKAKPELQESIIKGIGKYFRHDYKIFRDPNYRPLREHIIDAKAYIKKQNLKAGIRKSDSQLEKDVQMILANKNFDDIKIPYKVNKKGEPTHFLTSQKLNRSPLLQRTLPEELQPLFGKIDDPAKQSLNTLVSLSNLLRGEQYFDVIKKLANNKFLFTSKNAARSLGIRNPVKIDDIARTGEIDVGKGISDSLTKGVDEAVEQNLFKLKDFWGDADTIKAVLEVQDIYTKNFLGKVWNYGMVLPKAGSQITKTLYSPFTHKRNFISAGFFAAMMGNWNFAASKYPRRLAWGPSLRQLNISSKFDTPEGLEAYMDWQRRGTINTAPQVLEMEAMIKDITRNGREHAGVFKAALERMSNALPGKLHRFAKKTYMAEDDWWKIHNSSAEYEKLLKQYQKHGFNIGDDVLYFNKRVKLTDDFLKDVASGLVRNNMPNYNYAPSFIKTLRRLPFGNFVTFQYEMLRTGMNNIVRGAREARDPILKSIGIKRLLSSGAVLVGQPAITFAAGMGLYNFTADQYRALRSHLPKYSKNSSIFPMKIKNKETGKMEYKYVDASQFNPYDPLIRPVITAINNFDKAKIEGLDFEDALSKTMFESAYELFQPFIDESIYTERVIDIWPRMGVSSEGRRIWNKKDPGWEKREKAFTHLLDAFKPGSINQIERIIKSAAGEPVGDKLYKTPNEVLGIVGLRVVDVDPNRSMPFYVTEYKNSIRESRTVFTSDSFRGIKTPRYLVEQYRTSDQARFLTQKKFARAIEDAKILGMTDGEIRKILKSRGVSTRTYNKLKQNKYDPYLPGKSIKNAFKRQYKLYGFPERNPYPEAFIDIKQIYSARKNKTLLEGYEDFNIYEDEYDPIYRELKPILDQDAPKFDYLKPSEYEFLKPQSSIKTKDTKNLASMNLPTTQNKLAFKERAKFAFPYDTIFAKKGGYFQDLIEQRDDKNNNNWSKESLRKRQAVLKANQAKKDEITYKKPKRLTSIMMEAAPDPGRMYKDFPLEEKLETGSTDIYSLFPHASIIGKPGGDIEGVTTYDPWGIPGGFPKYKPDILEKIEKQKTSNKEVERLRENQKFANVFGKNWEKKKNINIPINVEEYFIRKLENEKREKDSVTEKEDDVTIMHMWPKEKNVHTFRKSVENHIRNKYIEDFDSNMLDQIQDLDIMEKYLNNNISPESFASDAITKVLAERPNLIGRKERYLKPVLNPNIRAKAGERIFAHKLTKFTKDFLKKSKEIWIKSYESRKKIKKELGADQLPKIGIFPNVEGLLMDKDVRRKMKRDTINAIRAVNALLYPLREQNIAKQKIYYPSSEKGGRPIETTIGDLVIKVKDQFIKDYTITATSGGLPMPLGPGIETTIKTPGGNLAFDIDFSGPGFGLMALWKSIARILEKPVFKNTYIHWNKPKDYKNLTKEQKNILKDDADYRRDKYNDVTKVMKKTPGWLYYGFEVDMTKPPFIWPMFGPTVKGDWRQGLIPALKQGGKDMLEPFHNLIDVFQGLTEKRQEDIPLTNPYDPTQTRNKPIEIPVDAIEKVKGTD